MREWERKVESLTQEQLRLKSNIDSLTRDLAQSQKDHIDALNKLSNQASEQEKSKDKTLEITHATLQEVTRVMGKVVDNETQKQKSKECLIL